MRLRAAILAISWSWWISQLAYLSTLAREVISLCTALGQRRFATSASTAVLSSVFQVCHIGVLDLKLGLMLGLMLTSCGIWSDPVRSAAPLY